MLDKKQEFKGKRTALSLEDEIPGYTLVFSDNDLYRVKYWDGMDLLDYYTEKRFKKLIRNNETKNPISKNYKFENFNVFQLYKLSSLKVALIAEGKKNEQ